MALRICLGLLLTSTYVYSQMTWTPIFVGSDSQVDFWTQSETGCPCNFNSSSKECACCVLSGGCSCGISMPKRCTQCGLEQYCTNMCNITLDSTELLIKSNRGFGQIKSPSVIGPTECTYRFIPDTGQRVELQIYRLISIGRHNGKTCEGGWLQLEGGARICGSNARFDRPVVLFSDKPESTLHLQINESTTRSQFLAYFSFASKASLSVGWAIKGGKAVNNTVCDWIYDDCKSAECVLASPGYPGLYPPNISCHYLIQSDNEASINIVFESVLLSYNRCDNDSIAVYAGSNTSSTVLKMLCNNEKVTLVHSGSALLVEFKSGPEMSPFNYNGFLARVTITELTTMTAFTATNAADIEVSTSAMNNHGKYRDSKDLFKDKNPICNIEIDGNKVRSGHYDTRKKNLSTSCRIILRGRLHDTVHLVLTNYNLSEPECKSIIEIWDGVEGEISQKSVKLLKKICSPDGKLAHEHHHYDRYIERPTYSSTANEMTVILKRIANQTNDEEFMDLSFYFHDEREEGTLRPSSACDVEYYGLTSSKQGPLVNAMSMHFKMENYISCKQHFISAANQSVVLAVESDRSLKLTNSSCDTLCGDSGCGCDSKEPLSQIDHLKLGLESGYVIICLCGNYQNWLPLRVRSWSPMFIQWHSKSSSWDAGLKASYQFAEDAYCGDHSSNKLEGSVNAGDFTNNDAISNQYYQQQCTWILDSMHDRQLTIEIESSQDRPCTAWNLTIHEYKKSGNPIGLRLHTFCSRDRRKNFTLPWKTNAAIIRLQALGRTAPQYTMKWRSVTSIGDIQRSGPSPAPNYVSTTSISMPSDQYFYFITLIIAHFLST